MKPVRIYLRTTMVSLFIVFLSADLQGQDNQGNPLPHFLFPSFREGLVKMKDRSNFSTLLNYNMVDEKMITELNGVYRYSKDPQLIDTIIIEKRVFVPVENKFYELLSGGWVTFFLENKSLATPRGNDIGYGARSHSSAPTQYKRYELTEVIYQYGSVVNIDLPPNIDITPASVFWVKKDGNLEKYTNEKQFLKIFPEFENELKEYIKKENIKVKTREDAIKLGNYCNELIMKK
jgi:hypothetical protein